MQAARNRGNKSCDRGKPNPQSKRLAKREVEGIRSSPSPAVFVSGFFKRRGRTLRPAFIFSYRSCDTWVGSELGIVAWYDSILVGRVSLKKPAMTCDQRPDSHWVVSFAHRGETRAKRPLLHVELQKSSKDWIIV